MCNYRKSKKWIETWKNYKKNNKEKIKESNRKYYFKVTKIKKEKSKIIKKKDKVKLNNINIIFKPIVLDFS